MKSLCQRPVWAEINLDNLEHNIRQIRKFVDDKSRIVAVVKADGYGHGCVEIGNLLLENGVDMFAVSTLNEAILMRRHYPDVDVLILGYTPDEHAFSLIDNNFIQTIYDSNQADVFDSVARNNNTKIRVHIKIDTGMGRIGIIPNEQGIDAVESICKCKNLDIEGIYTHFSTADFKDKTYTRMQNDKFIDVVRKLENKGIDIPIKHVSNSAAIIDLKDMNYDMVRAGIMMYGLYPSDNVDKSQIELKPVMSLKSYVAHVKTLPKGCDIGYGRTYTTDKQSIIATLPFGYADGYSRLYAKNAKILHSGNMYPLMGSICMDQCMADMTGSDVKRADEVIMIGKDGELNISMEDVASWMGTISYETMCMIGKRVPRVYIKNGKVLHIYDDIVSNLRKKLEI